MSDRYEAAATDLPAIREICEQYGFCLVKDALAPSQLDRLLTGMKAAKDASRGGPLSDLLGVPEVRYIYVEPRLLEIGRTLVGRDLVYDGEATLNYEDTIGTHTLNPFTVLHCDAIGMPQDLRAIWNSPDDAIYRAYRFGIYFQDYTRASGSLKVIVGSHRGDPSRYIGENLISKTFTKRAIGLRKLKYAETLYPLYNVPSQPGDVVIWNLRTFHSAGAKRFVDDPAFAVHPDLEIQLADVPDVFAPPPGPRNALFFDYAAPAADIDLYIKYRARPSPETLAATLARRSDDEGALALAALHGIEVRHDPLIAALAVTLAMGTATDPAAARNRLFKLLTTHTEYSSFYPLFDRGRFLRAASRDQAVDGAISNIVRTLKSEGVLAPRPVAATS